MGEVILDALIDTLKILPFLLVMNFLIEFVEYRTKGLKADQMLRGGLAPLLGAAVGIVPQCGFSVVATELYSKRKITLGTLFAVYLVTSDEALPIMLSSREGLIKLWPILIIKVVFALIVGYGTFGIEKLVGRHRAANAEPNGVAKVDAQNLVAESKNIDTADGHAHSHESDGEHDENDDDGTEVHIHGCHHHELDESTPPSADASKKERAAWVWRTFLKHPLLHTGTVILFIFIVNAVFGTAVYYVGEQRLAEFIGATGYLQPVLAALIGLIPNCAGSVVITEMYVVGGLNLGGAVAGLCVSAGIGYAVLIKQNRPIKNTVMIIAVMYALSVVLGVCITACGF